VEELAVKVGAVYALYSIYKCQPILNEDGFTKRGREKILISPALYQQLRKIRMTCRVLKIKDCFFIIKKLSEEGCLCFSAFVEFFPTIYNEPRVDESEWYVM